MGHSGLLRRLFHEPYLQTKALPVQELGAHERDAVGIVGGVLHLASGALCADGFTEGGGRCSGQGPNLRLVDAECSLGCFKYRRFR
jgi:hypothetical protein